MKRLRSLANNIKDNLAEYYGSVVLFIAVPASVGVLVGWKWGLLLSFVLQAIICSLYVVKRGAK